MNKQTYIGTKIVEASAMTRGEYNKYRGWKIPEDENPNDEGYLVIYQDGYKSWCPKKQFDEAYRVYDFKELSSTALGMLSKDYKERFKAEYKQVLIRLVKLRAFVEKMESGVLDFEPDCPKALFEKQICAMTDYITVLEQRAEIEKINLNEV